jgi:hypothetical protein
MSVQQDQANMGNKLPLFAFLNFSCRALEQEPAVNGVSQLPSYLVEQLHGET